jgi:hypothetical protein
MFSKTVIMSYGGVKYVDIYQPGMGKMIRRSGNQLKPIGIRFFDVKFIFANPHAALVP